MRGLKPITFTDTVYKAFGMSHYETMLTHIIFDIHVNSKLQQKLHDIRMSS